MALNFEKLPAIVAQNYDGTKVLLPDEQRAQLLQILVNEKPSIEWGTGLSRLNIDGGNGGSVTFGIPLDGERRSKTDIGSGTVRPTKVKPITCYWEDPNFYNHGFTKFDLNRGVLGTTEEYLRKYLTQELNFQERAIAQKMFDYCVDNDLTDDSLNFFASTTTPDMVADYIENLAIQKLKFVSAEYGINHLPRENIVIQVPTKVLALLAKTGRIGNFAQQTITGGAFIITTFAGFSITRNDWLPDEVQALVGTNVAWATAVDNIATNAGKVDNLSNDQAVYFEIAYINAPAVAITLTASIAPTTNN